MRRILLVLTVALVMVAMTASSATAAQPTFFYVPAPAKGPITPIFDTKAECDAFVAANPEFGFKACHPTPSRF